MTSPQRLRRKWLQHLKRNAIKNAGIARFYFVYRYMIELVFLLKSHFDSHSPEQT